MSFLYPRTISIHRSRTVSAETPALGLTGYSGREQNTSASDAEGESVLFTGICCNIDALRRLGSADLPSDEGTRTHWVISIPAISLAQYSIRDRDIIVDDEGYRYMVSQNYWTPIGYQLTCVREEA